MRRREQMVLGAYLSYGTGHHAASWIHPSTDANSSRSLPHYQRMAKTADQSVFDFMFLSDAPAVFNDDAVGQGGRVVFFEPTTLTAALIPHTERLGFVVTASTTYNEPYNVARTMAGLDLLSSGRIGWNLVTTSKVAAGRNFGFKEHPPHQIRYERAEEFIDVVRSLWDTWDDDAVLADRATVRYYDPTRRHVTRFKGEHFDIEGELNVPRPVQGHPVLFQAGSSVAGKELAARTADAIFTAQPDIEAALTFAADLDERVQRHRNGSASPLILPGLTIYTGPDKKAAIDSRRELEEMVPEELGLSMLSDLLGGVDLHNADPDGPLPEVPLGNGNRSRQRLILDRAQRESLTIRQLFQWISTSRGHATITDSYDGVVSTIQDWFDAGAVDGFNIMPATLPGGLDEFIEHIVPRLTARGLSPSTGRTGTLRERLTLPRPASSFAS
ncbi:LLM class flavin-dependent oxidoreductase [Arthrobacter sp. NPDC090010]|uniref:LLM class flavin-dependent oxidoreductase n=1 Tax=Arthrobacter sp. NPDC090010 TaxID=3363942 RepID=UPI00380B862A